MGAGPPASTMAATQQLLLLVPRALCPVAASVVFQTGIYTFDLVAFSQSSL